MPTGSKPPRRVRFVVQPTVSHYRAPLVRQLLESNQFEFSLFGFHADENARRIDDKIKTADVDVISHVDPVQSKNVGVFRWERNAIMTAATGRYDAIVFEGRVYTVSTWLAMAIARLRRMPVFLWGHGWKRPEYGIKRQVRLLFYKLSNGLLVYGEAARERAIEYGVAPGAVKVVGNSIYSYRQLNKTDPLPSNQQGSMVIIMSARLTGRHRFELVADALRYLGEAARQFEIHVVGGGSERERLEKELKTTDARIKFHGPVYDIERLRRLYSLADVAVSPRASGLNIVQAMGFGRPVVAPVGDPTAGPEAELVVNNETGRTFSLDDSEDLAAVLLDLARNPEQRVHLGRRAYHSVLRTHTAEAHATAIEHALLQWLDTECDK